VDAAANSEDAAREPRRDHRGGRPKSRGGHRGPPRERHRESEPREHRQPAPVARIEEARQRQAPARSREPVDNGGDHLPAFLLRPVRSKA
jgi:hypothetical protein